MSGAGRRILLGVALLVFGVGLCWRSGASAGELKPAPTLIASLGGVAIALAVACLSTPFVSRGSAAVFRLDIFLPFLRRQREKDPAEPLPLRMIRAILPHGLLSEPKVSRRPGLIRRWLEWCGPTAASAPLRRIVQAVCLAVFLWLFFYVCWPYTAQPASEGASSPGWTMIRISQEESTVVFGGEESLPWTPDAGDSIHLFSRDELTGDTEYFGELQIVSVADDDKNHWTARGEPDLLTSLLVRPGPWTASDKPPVIWPSHYADDFEAKEFVAADLFLFLDPLVSLSTAIAARSWVWSLTCAAAILIACLLIPRGFCGYLCPLGTVIDVFDWLVGKRVTRFRAAADGWWVHLKYYVLFSVIVAALGGVLISGYVAAIPVVTRAALMLGEPLQSGLLRRWSLVPAFNLGHVVSLVLFGAVLALGLLRPRFWCKYVCPSGAVFSLGNLFRLSERKVESSCIHCDKCIEICPFDAIKPDYTTRTTDCTLCQTCAGVCPTHAIKFVERWNLVELKTENDPPTGETPLGRRGFLSLAAGTAAAVVSGAAAVGATKVFGAGLGGEDAFLPVRPPGSVPEPEFLQMCIRCGECFKACPNNVLQPLSFEQGLDGLWTPQVVADWAGCDPSCNACGQVCPTGAIRELSLPEKKTARMGLAILNQETCLPLAGREACDLCVVECQDAGYNAIEFTRTGTELDDEGRPIEGSGFLAPVVIDEKCVGCGVCQTRCYGINVQEKGLLSESAIIIEAGEGREDRIMSGSYIELRRREAAQPPLETPLPTPAQPKPTDDDPFGL